MPLSEAPKTTTAQVWVFIRAIVAGALIAVAGIAPWVIVITLNARIHPELPWAACATLVYLFVLMAWLNGWGWPKGSHDFRRHSLRLWRPAPGTWRGGSFGGLFALMVAAVALYPTWILMSPHRAPEFGAYPTTAYRISVLLMGPLVSGVVEEAAFRGYMQSQLERFGPTIAIVAPSIVFALAHLTHGLGALAMFPGLFIAGVVYGLLALRSGSILPGMVIHALGDTAFAYFVLLNGDYRLLLVN